MKKNILKRIVAMLCLLCCLSVTTAYADVTQDEIDKAKNELDKLQTQKEDAEAAVDDIITQKDGLEDNLGSLNNQMTEIISSMNELESRISTKQNEIDLAQAEIDETNQKIADTQAELEEAEAQSADQYEDMKTRIQYMYENSKKSALELLMTSSSFSDFLNRTEYISEINSYDREMLTQYQNLQEQIAEKKQSLEEDERLLEEKKQELVDGKSELLAMQSQMKGKQDSVNSLISATQDNLSQTENNLASVQSEVESLSKKIADMEEYERQLEIQKAREDAARLEAIKEEENEDTSNVTYIPSDSDLYLLGAIIQCESDGEPYAGKLAVGSVVMNRVKSSYFPNSISGVIYQNNQFSPVASGRFAYRLEAGVNNTCLQAAQEVLDGNITNNCLYFRTNNGIISGTVIGNHVFY